MGETSGRVLSASEFASPFEYDFAVVWDSHYFALIVAVLLFVECDWVDWAVIVAIWFLAALLNQIRQILAQFLLRFPHH